MHIQLANCRHTSTVSTNAKSAAMSFTRTFPSGVPLLRQKEFQPDHSLNLGNTPRHATLNIKSQTTTVSHQHPFEPTNTSSSQCCTSDTAADNRTTRNERLPRVSSGKCARTGSTSSSRCMYKTVPMLLDTDSGSELCRAPEVLHHADQDGDKTSGAESDQTDVKRSHVLNKCCMTTWVRHALSRASNEVVPTLNPPLRSLAPPIPLTSLVDRDYRVMINRPGYWQRGGADIPTETFSDPVLQAAYELLHEDPKNAFANTSAPIKPGYDSPRQISHNSDMVTSSTETLMTAVTTRQMYTPKPLGMVYLPPLWPAAGSKDYQYLYTPYLQ